METTAKQNFLNNLQLEEIFHNSTSLNLSKSVTLIFNQPVLLDTYGSVDKITIDDENLDYFKNLLDNNKDAASRIIDYKISIKIAKRTKFAIFKDRIMRKMNGRFYHKLSSNDYLYFKDFDFNQKIPYKSIKSLLLKKLDIVEELVYCINNKEPYSYNDKDIVIELSVYNEKDMYGYILKKGIRYTILSNTITIKY